MERDALITMFFSRIVCMQRRSIGIAMHLLRWAISGDYQCCCIATQIHSLKRFGERMICGDFDDLQRRAV